MKSDSIEFEDSSAPQLIIKAGVDYQSCKLNEQCAWYDNQLKTSLVGRYIAQTTVFEEQILSACIPLAGLDSGSIEDKMRKHSKGAALRQANKAVKKGYVFKQVNPKCYIEDIVGINLSTPQRAGKEMTTPYRRSIEELADYASNAPEYQSSVCNTHWDRWWGVFQSDSDQMVAYARIRRNGNFVLYAQWLGHFEFLKDGIMNGLHVSILNWLCEHSNPVVSGLEFVVYAAWHSGDGGLQSWKKRCGFEPSWLVMDGGNVG